MARTGMSDLITRLRERIADPWEIYQETATGDGTTKVYWLSSNPQAAGGTVSVGGTVQGTAAYTWDNNYGRLEITSAPANAVVVAVEYQHAGYTDNELQDILDEHVSFVERRVLVWRPDVVAGGSSTYHRADLGYGDVEGTASGTIYWDLTDGLGAAAPTYTMDPIVGQVRFTTDCGGTAYYWTGRSYDLWAAAADVWEQKAASMADWYSFASGGERYERQQAYKQAAEQAARCRARTGQNRQRGTVQSSIFARTDLAPRK